MIFPAKCPACNDHFRLADLIADKDGVIEMWVCGNCKSDMIGCHFLRNAGIDLKLCLLWLEAKEMGVGLNMNNYTHIIAYFKEVTKEQ